MTKLTLQAQAEDIQTAAPKEGLEIATLTIYDIPALAGLALSAHGEPSTAQALWGATDEMRLYFDGAFGAPRDDSFVGAWVDGELVGGAFLVLDAPFEGVPRGPFIIDLLVAEPWQRQGIATALVNELTKRASAWGYDSVALRLDGAQMPGALKLYQGLGFEEVRDVPDEE